MHTRGMDGGQTYITMTQQHLSHDDKTKKNTEILAKKLDRISIPHIKELSEKIKRCSGMPKPWKKNNFFDTKTTKSPI